MPNIDGIDVSHYQVIDWPKVPLLSFIGVKATQGVANKDPKFAANWAAMRARGTTELHIAYHFMERGRVSDQFNNFARTVGDLLDHEAVMLDVESTPAITTSDTLDMLKRLQDHYGRTPILYMGAYYPDAANPELAAYPLWLPGYSGGAQPTKTVRPQSIWQFSSSGSVAGIAGRVDVNEVSNPLSLIPCVKALPPVPPAPVVPMPPTLRIGSFGDEVKALQWDIAFIIGHAYWEAPGIFGTPTQNWVKDQQRFWGMTPNGVVDNKTWQLIANLVKSKGGTPMVPVR